MESHSFRIDAFHGVSPLAFAGRSIECECMLVIARCWSIQHHTTELLYNFVSARRQRAPTDMIKNHLLHIAVVVDNIDNKTILVGTLNDSGQILA